MEEIHFKMLTYKLLECDDEHFLFLDKHDVEESCTVYSLIFMLEMLKKKERTTHIAMHSALNIICCILKLLKVSYTDVR